MMINSLKEALIRHGHEVEIVTIPFKFFPDSYIKDSMDIWIKQDFNDFNGYSIDKAIVLQFPAYYVKHHNKTLWLMHQHRAVYELCDDKTDTSLKEIITQNDNSILPKIKHRFAISKTVAKRLYRYNAITSTPLFHPPANEDRFYCDKSENYIFSPSRLEKLKRQDLLIKAMQFTKTPIKAIIAGVGGEYQNYQNLIDKLKLNHKVRLIGHISEEEKYKFYASSLAVVFTPFEEDYGYVTLEAMLSSKPVITCSDSGAVLEFIKDNQTGYIVEPDPKELAQRLDDCHNDKQKTARLGINAKESYLSKSISWDSVVEKLLED